MRELLKPVNFFRRKIASFFDKSYVRKKLALRQGKCLKCGKCCRGCKYLKRNLCSRYNNRPFLCYREFPLDKFDKWVWNVPNCGYKFNLDSALLNNYCLFNKS